MSWVTPSQPVQLSWAWMQLSWLPALSSRGLAISGSLSSGPPPLLPKPQSQGAAGAQTLSRQLLCMAHDGTRTRSSRAEAELQDPSHPTSHTPLSTPHCLYLTVPTPCCPHPTPTPHCEAAARSGACGMRRQGRGRREGRKSEGRNKKDREQSPAPRPIRHTDQGDLFVCLLQ